MEAVDPNGYKAIIANFDAFLNSNVDPADLGAKLVDHGIIHFTLRETVRAQQTSKEKLGLLIEAVLKSGNPKCFEQFMDCLSGDCSIEWLTTRLRGSCRVV